MPQTAPQPDPTTQGRARAWTHYWASGTQHSLAGSFDANYSGQIGAFWHSVFAAIAPDARVLDACCGNSPLGRLLMESEFGQRVAHLAAVDAAQVSPAWLSHVTPQISSRVAVHAATDVAALPFPDAGFDLCISQYGIEYAGAPAFVECARVLRAGGRLAAVVHHVDALPVRIGREECGHIDVLLGEAGLYACARAMIEPLARAATEAGRAALMHDADANAARSALNQSLRALQERIDAARYPDVLLEQRDALMQLLARIPQVGTEAGYRHLEEMHQALLEGQLRQRELVEFALDEQGVRTAMEAFPGEIRQLAPLMFDNGEVAGWALMAVRS